ASLQTQMGIDIASSDITMPAHDAIPADADAARFYAEGMSRLRRFDVVGARQSLEHACELAPAHAGSHMALGWAWHALGYEQRAIEEAGRAFSLSRALAWAERVDIEGGFALMQRQWTEAAQVYTLLVDAFPHDVSHALNLSTALRNTSRFDQA